MGAEATRILILGGGFAGAMTAIHLDRIFARAENVEITLVSDENFLLFTPMLPEVGTGAIEPRHIVSPIRACFRNVRFQNGEIRSIDIEKRVAVVSHCPVCRLHELKFDYLVLAMGSTTNFYGLPGVAEYAMPMKTMNDAMKLRNQMIDVFEHADMERDPPTAQHAIRQAKTLAVNIAASIRAGTKRPFSYKPIGVLASLGRRSAVAEIGGWRFSGFFAWWLWRTVYLSKLPGLERKVRVAIDWTLDLFFPRDIVLLKTFAKPAPSETPLDLGTTEISSY